LSDQHYRSSTFKWTWMVECADEHWEQGLIYQISLLLFQYVY
jgi:hypothetical protein